MGFFGNLGKALAGQPISPLDAENAQASGHVSDVNQGPKVIPKIELKNIQSHHQADHLIVTAWVQNDSNQPIRIDYCYLLRQKTQFNQMLGPNQSHQLNLYQGPAPRDENEHEAQIVYRLQSNGDSFQNSYRVVYHLEPDGTRSVDTLQVDGPIKDM